MIRFDGSDSIEELLEHFPMCESVMADLGISCDVRHQSVCDVIDEAGLPPGMALAHIAAAAIHCPDHIEEDWSSFGLDELTDHIEQHHHEFTRCSLARLDAIIGVLKDDEQHPLRAAFIPFKHQLLCHLEEEEQHLFPQCRQLELDAKTWLRNNKDLRQVSASINREHDDFSDQLELLLESSHRESWPSEYTEYQQAFTQALETLAGDLAIHAHLEYEYLIPSALHLAKLERSRVESQIQRQQRRESAELGPN